MEYMTTSQKAAEWGVSRRLVSKYCADGRIEGAMHIGNTWLVPSDAKKPLDPRRSPKKRTQ